MQCEVIQDGTGNYLKVRGAEREVISDRMFLYQEIPGFLPMELRRINGEKEYVFNISGRLSLKKFLDRENFSRTEIQQMFRQIFDMADSMEEYLLDSRSVVIQEEFLYLDPGRERWEGIYHEDHKQGTAQAVGYLLEAIMEKMNQEDRELVFFIYGMHKLTRGADCTRSMLREYITEEMSANIPAENREIPEAVPAAPGTRTVSVLTPQRRKLPWLWFIRGRFLPGMILAAGMILPIILWRMGMFRLPVSGGTDWVKAAGTALFFLGVSGYGVWKTLPEHDSKEKGVPICYREEERERKRVCLIPQTGDEEVLPIPYFPYRIRMADRAGHSAVNILQEAGVVMVMDEESGQAVYHNERRLSAWHKTPLEDGDLLRIGGHEYVVEITQPEYVM